MSQLTFGLLLARYRTRAGLSQYRLATACDLDHSYISRIESNRREPSRDVVTRLIQVLDLDGDDRMQFYGAAGFMPIGAHVVTRPILAELDALLTGADLTVRAVVVEQLKALVRTIDIMQQRDCRVAS